MHRNYEQETFKYQLKCLNWLQEKYSHLQRASRERVDTVLAETGCPRFILSYLFCKHTRNMPDQAETHMELLAIL